MRLSKTLLKTFVTEQRGVCGWQKPTARSIKQNFKTFKTFLKVLKSAQRGEKTFSTR